jgi:hypothetical protein
VSGHSTHTPGPWEVERKCDPHTGEWFEVSGAIFPGHVGVVVETSNRDHCLDPETDRANARLIAAAPELYATLREVHKELAYFLERNDVDHGGELRGTIERIRRALAKARGETTP